MSVLHNVGRTEKYTVQSALFSQANNGRNYTTVVFTTKKQNAETESVGHYNFNVHLLRHYWNNMFFIVHVAVELYYCLILADIWVS